MKRVRTVLALAVLGAAWVGPAAAGPFEVDTIVLVDSTEREGRVVAVDESDIQFQEDPRGKTRLIPLAEVRKIVWANGQESVHAVIDDPLPGDVPQGALVRSSARFRRDDLELSRWEVSYNAFGRGVMAGAIATFFTSDPEQKKIAFAVGFVAHFGISLYTGW